MAGNEINEEFIILAKKYREGTASDQEILFLEKYYDYFKKESAIISTLSEIEKQALEKEIQQAIWKKIRQPAIVVAFYRTKWFRVAAAAILILFATGAVFLLNRQKHNDTATIIKEQPSPDIKPGGNKAILTLGDNSQIVLDNMQNGKLAQQGNTKVLKLDNGQIVYKASGETTEVIYNTISTPKGGQYQLTLADGTKVWLNAESSIRFPTSFPGAERIVELSGEGYFEVSKNANAPFHVRVLARQPGGNDIDVQVLGTHFNINSYNDEPVIKTTLLEGAVKISKGTVIQMLSPGQQAQVNNSSISAGGEIRVVKNIDVDEPVAWKNGYFQFNSLGIEDIMRQVARWYNVDVVYQGTINNETFSAIVGRDKNLSEVLKIMIEGGVRFKIEGRKIIVLP